MTTLPASIETGGTTKFYFQGQKLLLTYSDVHIDKEALIEMIADRAGFELKFARCAHETGLSTGVPFKHTHVLIDFGKRFQTRDCRRFDWNSGDGNPHPNFRPVKSATHWHNCTQYLGKEDPENQDLLVVSCVGRVWNSASLQDALLNNCEKPSDALGIAALWGARPAQTPDVATPNRPWQQDVLKLVQDKPHPRAIHWFYDPVGDTGKTWLSRYLMANKIAYSVKQACGSYHFATILQGAIAAGWDQRCFIFDLPRTCEDLAFYGPLEEVKDGHVTAVKYQGGSLIFNQPHVLVLANFLPKREKLSRDRWRVHEILPDLTLKPPLGALLGASVGEPTPTESDDLTLKESRQTAPRDDNVSSNDLSVADLAEVLGDLGALI